MIIIILGPPGSGKSTQAKLLAEKLEVPAISMGQVLREAIQAETSIGLEASKYVHKGELIPAKMIEVLTKFRLEEKDCKEGFVLDGAPRRAKEAVMFDKYLKSKNWHIDKVFYLDLSDEKATKRLLKRYELPEEKGGKREDDNMEDIKVRMKVFHEEIEPLKVYYQGKDLLEIIDGDREVEQIHKDICRKLKI